MEDSHAPSLAAGDCVNVGDFDGLILRMSLPTAAFCCAVLPSLCTAVGRAWLATGMGGVGLDSATLFCPGAHAVRIAKLLTRRCSKPFEITCSSKLDVRSHPYLSLKRWGSQTPRRVRRKLQAPRIVHTGQGQPTEIISACQAPQSLVQLCRSICAVLLLYRAPHSAGLGARPQCASASTSRKSSIKTEGHPHFDLSFT